MIRPIHSPQFLKKRKFLMVLPLLVTPFLIILFFILGGGSGNGPQIDNEHFQGLNLKLPDAHFKKAKEKDKLGMYEEAAMDSDRIRSFMKNDPYAKRSDKPLSGNQPNALQSILQQSAARTGVHGIDSPVSLPFSNNTGVSENEQKVIEKLNQLKEVMNKPPGALSSDNNKYNPGKTSPDIERLQLLMNSVKHSGKQETDPELDRINGMLDKVMYIQHPEKMEDSLKALSSKNKGLIYPVKLSNENTVGMQKGFYGPEEIVDDETAISNSIAAVVEENQTLVSGSVIKLRLLQDIYVHGLLIQKNQLIYGTSSLSNERLKVSVTSIRFAGNILPVSLDVYDLDGLQGIYVPGSINRDVSKESADEAFSALGLTNLDPSIGAQAVNAGIQAAKTLMSKKIKLVRVNVRSGYQVLLKDSNQK